MPTQRHNSYGDLKALIQEASDKVERVVTGNKGTQERAVHDTISMIASSACTLLHASNIPTDSNKR